MNVSTVVIDWSGGDAERTGALLRHIANLQEALGGRVAVELVGYAAGLALLRGDSASGRQVAALQAAGLRLKACHNAMVSQGVSREQLLPGADVVPSGIAYLAERQLAGAAYLKM